MRLGQNGAALRALARRWVPLEARQHLAEARRRWQDRRAGLVLAVRQGGGHWPVQAVLQQPVRPGPLSENKRLNLQRGAQAIGQALIEPGQTWSFWAALGRPSAARGYAEGRNLVDGELRRHVGGGLCQLSSLLYHLALMAGLEIVERHAHSIDIYREEDRFTPLGADATVVWGYKDLRLKNPHRVAVSIEVALHEGGLVGRLRCERPIANEAPVFVRQRLGADRVRVFTMIGGLAHHVTEYRQRQGLQIR
ncbi:VanW family protein [Aquabacterium sp. A7-Y]|uniref:VanW family protein n=1 Tax=Aquabacterium sp. A7-Y TaxID=1349605 RepID=UPI00223CA8E9|nr:VanW family protein [Aquabacterium sp. A7-Y]MCW7539954.1 VanW family protein [Aquabacterium sp. A7-Y]